MLRHLGSHLWGHVRPLTAQQRFLSVVGVVLIASGIIHGVIAMGALASGDDWLGPLSWRKPVVFGLSFGMLSLTVAWILRLMPHRRWGWIPTALLGVFSVIEVTAITFQTWRGEPSHFNTATDVDAIIFSVMAISVLLVVLSLLLVLIGVLVQFRGNGGERLAVIVGLVCLIAAGYIGSDLISAGQAHLATTGSVPYEVVFGPEGSGKLAHFVGMHLVQFLAVLAIVSAERRRLALVALGSVGGVATFVSVTVTAYAGESWLAPAPAVGALGVVGIVIALVALALSMRSFASRPATLPPQSPQPQSPMTVG
ncbi:hypothetical protein [Microcella sp.]|uniref:hypothetical protein n=1 Tax=Microcella sp. TaxID=1913979 RepID=UPI003F70C1B4